MTWEIYNGQGDFIAGIGVERIPHRKSLAILATETSGVWKIVAYLRADEDRELLERVLEKLVRVKEIRNAGEER